MVQKIFVFISGVIFGTGLTISSMTNPAKVISFLDIFGMWDPSLAFVMGGAIFITSPLLFFFKNKQNLILTKKIILPSSKNIDINLIFGSILFGIGWGVVGFCPGPAISSIAFFNLYSILFIISMIIGFYIIEFFRTK
tara:strand:- start:472 stop:885 length:414 start_codon:yes stop_codon:yes gene_type:complete